MGETLSKTGTPGIFRAHRQECRETGRCKCPYVVTWRNRGRQERERRPTFGEARELKAERDAGGGRSRSKLRFGVYMPEWIETFAGLTERGLDEGTRTEYRRSLTRDVLPYWRTFKLGEIDSVDVRELFGRLRNQGRTTSRIKKAKAALSVLFSTAVNEGLVSVNPVLGVRVLTGRDEKPKDSRPKALTRAELNLLLGALPPDWLLFFEFLAHTGMRISEVLGLRWKHLDLGETPHVEVREQFYKGVRKSLKSTASERDIPLSTGMANRLLAHRASRYGGELSPVFASTRGTELSPQNIYNRVLAPTAIALGFAIDVEAKDGKQKKRSTISFHTFRHTCASLLFERRNVKQVQEWLGHTDPGFTLRRYVHLMDSGIGDAEFFDDAIEPLRPAEPSEDPAVRA